MVLKKGQALVKAERKMLSEMKKREKSHERWLKIAHQRFIIRQRALKKIQRAIKRNKKTRK